MIVLDTETTGLDPRADRLVLVGIASARGAPLVLRHDRDRAVIQGVLDRRTLFVGHHLVFDMAFLEAAGYRLPPPSCWVDTQLVAHVAGERKPGQTALRRLTQALAEAGELPDDILAPENAIKAWLTAERRRARKEDRSKPELGDAPAHLLEPYLRADVVATRVVARHYSRRINGQSKLLALEHRVLPVIYSAERRGVPLDLAAAVELRDRTAVTVADLRARAHRLAGATINLNSAQQIERALAARDVDVTALPRTPKAELPMFTAQVLEGIDDDLARAILRFREEKKLGDYVADLYRHTHGDRLYGHFRQLGTETGRMSSSGPNLQNIPKSDLRVRYVIRAAPGTVLVGADLDNVELRTLACYARGGRLEAALRDGVDLHQQTADELGITRDAGKTINYAILYGAGVPLIALRLGVERDVAAAILDRWYRLYPEVSRLKARLARTVRRRGYLLSIGGRRHEFEQPNHMLLNRLISGSCADMFKAALVEQHRPRLPMILFVHDEVVAEVHEDDAERAAALLERELARGMNRPGVSIGGLVAEAKVATRWSDFKEPGWTPEAMPRAPEPEQLPLAAIADQSDSIAAYVERYRQQQAP